MDYLHNVHDSIKMINKMKKILKVISSVKGDQSQSTQLANAIVEKLLNSYPGSSVQTKDLSEQEYAHFNKLHLQAFYAPVENQTSEIGEVSRHSDEAIREIQEADFIVIGVAIYNLTITSTVKAWVDHIVRAGKTFTYEKGYPEGLLRDKRVYLAIASGGVYSDGPSKAYDFAEPYLRAILGIIGLVDVSVFRAEGLRVDGIKETAMQKGIESIVL